MPRHDGIGEGEIGELIKRKLAEVRDKPPLTSDSWVRVSSLAYLCAREEALAVRTGVVRKDKISSDLKVIFEHGHALHWCLQNKVLPPLGILHGRWRCLRCSNAWGGKEEPWIHGSFTEDEFVSSQSPFVEHCPSCGTEMNGDTCLYEEQTFHHEGYLLSGHSDGFLLIQGIDGMGLLEAKSINPKGASELRACPKLDHVIQAHCYMWLTGLRWAKILYWDKAGGGLRSFVEHTVEYDEATVERVESLLRQVRSSTDVGRDLPSRICESRECPRAKNCEMVDYCFSERR